MTTDTHTAAAAVTEPVGAACRQATVAYRLSMDRRLRASRGWRNAIALGIAVAVLLLTLTSAQAQFEPENWNTNCKQWDDAYLDIFTVGFVLTVVGTLVCSALIGLLGRFWWWCAAPRLRIVVVALLMFAIAEAAVVILPWVVGFGILWFTAIDQRYFAECLTREFGAQGLLNGLIGAGAAAVTQWPAMTYLLAGATGLSALVAIAASETVTRLFGLRRRARREVA